MARRKTPDGNWNQAAWNLARKRVLASHDLVCAICHQPVDPDAPTFAPNHPEIDHIIPVSRGGSPYDVDNLQILCLRCNRKKGAKMDSDYIGKTAENPLPLSNPW